MSFAELGVKKRIKVLLNYRRPVSLIMYAAAVLCFGIFVTSFFSNGITVVSSGKLSASIETLSMTVQDVPTYYVTVGQDSIYSFEDLGFTPRGFTVSFVPDAAAAKKGLAEFHYSAYVFSENEEVQNTEKSEKAPALTVTGKSGTVTAAVKPDAHDYEVGTTLEVAVASVEADKDNPFFSFGFQEKPVSVAVYSVDPTKSVLSNQNNVSLELITDEAGNTGFTAPEGASYYAISVQYSEDGKHYTYYFIGIN